MSRRAGWLVALVALTGLGSAAAQADTPASGTGTFVDGRRGTSMTIQTSSTAPDAGRFVFRVPGLGNYVGEAGTAMRVQGRSNVQVRFEGAVTLRPALDGSGAITGSVLVPRAALIELRAELDLRRRSAEASLREGRARYELVARRLGRGDLDRTMKAVEQAILAEDPAALYPHLAGDLRAALSPAAFAAEWQAQAAAIGRISAMRQTAVTEPEVNELGFEFVVATYEVKRVTPAGVTTTNVFEVFFVREGDEWKLLLSRQR